MDARGGAKRTTDLHDLGVTSRRGSSAYVRVRDTHFLSHSDPGRRRLVTTSRGSRLSNFDGDGGLRATGAVRCERRAVAGGGQRNASLLLTTMAQFLCRRRASRAHAMLAPRRATPRHATPRHATPRHATPRHATRRATIVYGRTRALTPRTDGREPRRRVVVVRPSNYAFSRHGGRSVRHDGAPINGTLINRIFIAPDVMVTRLGHIWRSSADGVRLGMVPLSLLVGVFASRKCQKVSGFTCFQPELQNIVEMAGCFLLANSKLTETCAVLFICDETINVDFMLPHDS